MKNGKHFIDSLVKWTWPPGHEELARHVPALNRNSVKLWYTLMIYVAPWLVGLAVYFMDRQSPWYCVVTQAVLMGGCFLLVDVIGHWCRPLLQNILGDRAYAVAFSGLFIPGLFLGFAPGLLHIFIAPGRRIIPLTPALIVSLPFFVMFLLLSIRVYGRFGVDRLYYMYQYYPDEGTMAQDCVYDYIRHPQYASFVWFVPGLVIAAGTVQGVVMALFFMAYLPGRVLPEEADLSRRFKNKHRYVKLSTRCTSEKFCNCRFGHWPKILTNQ